MVAKEMRAACSVALSALLLCCIAWPAQSRAVEAKLPLQESLTRLSASLDSSIASLSTLLARHKQQQLSADHHPSSLAPAAGAPSMVEKAAAVLANAQPEGTRIDFDNNTSSVMTFQGREWGRDYTPSAVSSTSNTVDTADRDFGSIEIKPHIYPAEQRPVNHSNLRLKPKVLLQPIIDEECPTPCCGRPCCKSCEPPPPPPPPPQPKDLADKALRDANKHIDSANDRVKDLGWVASVLAEKRNPTNHLIQQTISLMKKIEAADVGSVPPGDQLDYDYRIKIEDAVKAATGNNASALKGMGFDDTAVAAPASALNLTELAEQLAEAKNDPNAIDAIIARIRTANPDAPDQDDDSVEGQAGSQATPNGFGEKVPQAVWDSDFSTRNEEQAERNKTDPNTPEGLAEARHIANKFAANSLEAGGRLGEDGPAKLVVAAAVKRISGVVDRLAGRINTMDKEQNDLMQRLMGTKGQNQTEAELAKQKAEENKVRRESEIAALVRNEVRILTNQMNTQLKGVKEIFLQEVRELLYSMRQSLHDEFVRSREVDHSLLLVAKNQGSGASIDLNEERLLRPVREKQRIDEDIAHALNKAFSKAEKIRTKVLSQQDSDQRSSKAEIAALEGRRHADEPSPELLHDALTRQAKGAREQIEKARQQALAREKEENVDAARDALRALLAPPANSTVSKAEQAALAPRNHGALSAEEIEAARKLMLAQKGQLVNADRNVDEVGKHLMAALQNVLNPKSDKSQSPLERQRQLQELQLIRNLALKQKSANDAQLAEQSLLNSQEQETQTKKAAEKAAAEDLRDESAAVQTPEYMAALKAEQQRKRANQVNSAKMGNQLAEVKEMEVDAEEEKSRRKSEKFSKQQRQRSEQLEKELGF